MARLHIQNKDLTTWYQKRIELLKDTVALLEQYSIPYWLDGGTLLGLYRDNDIILQDSDHDVGVKIEDVGENLWQLFEDLKSNPKYDTSVNDACHKHFRECLDSGSMKPFSALFGNYYKIQYKEKLKGKTVDHPYHTDVMVFYPYKDTYFYRISNHIFRFKAEHLKEFRYIEKWDLKLPIPKLTDDYLDIQYTPFWRNPGSFNAWTSDYWCHWLDYKTELPKDYSYKKMNS